MPSIKAFLSDQETKVDLLNNEAMALTIVSLLRERPDRPVTIGVHGDWGAGKSSILEMIEQSLESDEKVLCLKFNGWRFQGFEDAKIALIEGIVTGLLEKRPLLTKATEKVQEIFKRINWLKVAKSTGGLAVTAMTGIPSPDLIHSAVSAAIGAMRKPEDLAENAENAIEGLEGLLKPKDDSKNVPEEINEFRKAFDDLLIEANVEQLIVLIDDLDRCLPDTAIETLEAIRLFVFTPKTAFVVAADEAMIEYSVRKHFPDLPNSSGPQTYARNYLEKLIQIPFRIPALGEGETRIYVALALAEATLGQETEAFKKLLAYASEILKRPWLGGALEDGKVREALGTDNAAAADLIALSDRIGPILARGTSGNPRQIKRFLNAMFLRERMAEARGFGDDIQTSVLAKLMLAERFKPSFFDELVLEAASDADGKSKSIGGLERSQEDEPASPAGSKTDTKPTKPDAKTPKTPVSLPKEEESRWVQDEWVTSWARIEPMLATTDLRPYVFVANQQARMVMGTALGPLIKIITSLMGSRMSVVALEPELKQLTQAEASSVMQELASRVRSGELKTAPAGIDGMKVLVKAHPELQAQVIGFLRFLPVDELGLWIITGWGQILDGQKQELREIMQGWATQTSNKSLAEAAKAAICKERSNSRPSQRSKSRPRVVQCVAAVSCLI